MDAVIPKGGRYVVAVSGGVDSVALLHHLKDQPGLQLTVAHFDHGIRPDSHEDRRLVQMQARAYNLPFVYDQGRLGQGASEAEAREARYKFLRQVQQAVDAQAIITAHHEDDVLETAIINLLRGTGRRGLTSLDSHESLQRPLLHVPKHQLKQYAQANGLVWREDSTNDDPTYLRNYVRHKILPRFDTASRTQLIDIVKNTRQINRELDTHLTEQLNDKTVQGLLDQLWFSQLSHLEAMEVIAHWLRSHNIRGYDRRTLERLVIAAKTARPGTKVDIQQAVWLEVGIDNLRVVKPDHWEKPADKGIIVSYG